MLRVRVGTIAGVFGAVLMTASIGAAQLNAQERTIDQLMQRADQALYKAKAKGRNQVVQDKTR